MTRIDRDRAKQVLERATAARLLSLRELDEILALFTSGFPFAEALALAESIHVHVKVADVEVLPHGELRAWGSRPENERAGYVKYPYAGGVNLIFSSIPIAQDDLVAPPPRAQMPFVDHLGIDLREDGPATRALFDAVPARASSSGWRHVPQGGQGQSVYCCHAEVAEKHWVYPPDGAAWRRPVELAYGPLVIRAESMGCDLRPMDPATAFRAARAGDPLDRARFEDLGRFAAPTMAKFVDWFDAATATPGALTVREKALIALAVAHAHKSPYLIDSFAPRCLDAGAGAEELHEAVQVAAAVGAGAELAQAVQMQSALRGRGVI